MSVAPDGTGGAARAWRALVVCLALAIAHTWPLSSAPWRWSMNYHADAELNAWILSWVAHALPTAPAHLFDANIFAPEPLTLSYSDPLIAPALLVAPVRWLGGSPVLAFNLATMLGLALTAWSGWFVTWRWTGSSRAALVGGALVAFNVHVLTRLAHPAATHAWGLPLTLYFADALVERPTVRGRLWLAAIVAATAATSLYLLAFACLVAAVVAIVGSRSWPSLAAIAGGVAGGLILASPVLWPYMRLAAGGATRPVELVAQFSASAAGYLASTSWLDARWTRAFFTNDVDVFFAGVGAIVLAAIGAASAFASDAATRRRAIAIAVIAALGIVLSLGPSTAIYRWSYAWLVPLRGLRAAARFGYLYLIAIALFAAWGVAALERRWMSRPRVARGVVVAALGIVTVEAWQGPVRVEPFTRVPAIYSIVADAPDPVRLVELPFYPPDAIFANGEYVFNSTAHWRPLMNGYSGFTPDSYRRRSETFWFFPEERAFDAIRREGATHVMVHLARFTPQEVAAIERALDEHRDWQLLASDPFGNRLYRIVRPQ